MSAATDPVAVDAALINRHYEWVQPERLASFLGAHPTLVPLLENLHCQLSAAFPGARFVVRHLSSPRVPAPSGDGHLLVVVVPAQPIDDPSGQLSELLREWAPRQVAARAFLLVDVASDVVAPYASDEDAEALYVQRRSNDYKQYVDAARRFVVAPPNSRERFHAAAALSAIRRSHEPAVQPRQSDSMPPVDEQEQDGSNQVSTPR